MTYSFVIVELIKKFAKEHFDSTPLLDFAEEVERITTAKKPNLILNVDGKPFATFNAPFVHLSEQFLALFLFFLLLPEMFE